MAGTEVGIGPDEDDEPSNIDFRRNTMYVSVHHTIKDPASFLTRGLQLRQAGPEGLAVLQFLPAVNSQRATCLWEGDSIDAVREFIDGTLGDSSDQEYFPVAEERAFGLPATARS